jgi:beta-mannosidase
MKKYSLDWSLAHHASADHQPDTWVPATVPGAVQLDWARAHAWPDYWIGDNCKQYAWMENAFWTYRAKLDVPAPGAEEELYFVCGGVDYQFEIWLNGTRLHEQEGMFTPVRLNLTGHARPGDELRVLVHPAPKLDKGPWKVTHSITNCKPTVSKGWDFHPPLNPLGIWRETFLEICPRQHIRESELHYDLSPDLKKATIRQTLTPNERQPARVLWRLKNPEGNDVFTCEAATNGDAVELDAVLDNPVLWWTHDHGTPALYTNEVELRSLSGELLDSRTTRVGFRTVRLVMYEGAWDAPDLYPRTRNPPPVTVELNGRHLFVRGTNMVSPSIFPGTITRETYAPLVAAMKDVNFNLVRMWGGAIVPPDDLYDLCDEAGILVWQEFQMACAYYPDDPHYLRILDQESRSIIKRLRSRTSLAFWCGGNELFNFWSGMDDQSHALRLLNRNCFDLDRNRPFIPTSPLMGMGHGNYIFYNWKTDEELFSLFSREHYTAYTEFGVGGMTSTEHIRTFIPEKELFPPARGTSWVTHHALDAWDGDIDTHLTPRSIERYLGPSTTLEELCAKSQRLQAIGMQVQYEEARRQKPKCSMAINWCLNEPWPNAANNSLIAWPFHPKPSLATVRAACRPVLASARIGKFMWEPGELFFAELWLLSDSPEPVDALVVEAEIECAGRTEKVVSWKSDPLAPNTNLRGPRVEFQLPSGAGKNFTLHLRVEGHPHLNSTYPLIFTTATKTS